MRSREWGAIRKREIVMAECVRCDDCERLYDDTARCPHWLLGAKPKARLASGGESPPPLRPGSAAPLNRPVTAE